MIEIPDLPDKHCFEAGLVHLFLVDAAVEFDKLAVGQAEPCGNVLTHAQYEGRLRRINMASAFLIEYLGDCGDCFFSEPAEVCPLQSRLDFIRNTVL